MRLLDSIHTLDLLTFEWCLKRKHRAIAVSIARWLSFSANGPFYGVVALAFIFWQNWPTVQLLALGFAVERCIYFVFKSLFKRNRPPAAIPGYRSIIEPADQFSFPSGHTSAAFLVACVVCLHFPLATWLVLPWAAGVGAARVVLGVHFPTDVIAGAAIGWAVCICTNMYLEA